eukprot:g4480.t1
MWSRVSLRPIHGLSVQQLQSRYGHYNLASSFHKCRRCITTATAASSSPSIQTKDLDVFSEDKRPVILFDGICNFCNAGVNLVLSLDDRESFRFAALQSKTGKSLLKRCNRDPEDISSMVVVEENGFYLRSDAALKIAERLRIPFPLLSTLISVVPKETRDRSYDWIAENRYNLFGMRDECRISDRKNYERFMS